ncbi:MAG: hypothetical protein HQL70_11375 [Magnetococcales bacterium]|nr:hypothetical protein [Magnetococcales bacterium]
MTSRQFGGSNLKMMIVLLAFGAFFTVTFRVVPGLYNYYILRDLADRVVVDYVDLDLPTIKKRIDFELDRNHIDADDETFVVIKSGLGYRVYVDYQISMEFMLGEYLISMDGYENFSLTYETES